jgi:hypothetical protein
MRVFSRQRQQQRLCLQSSAGSNVQQQRCVSQRCQLLEIN